MANKLTLQNLVTTNLPDGSGILATAHREVENALIDNSYATKVTESLTGFIDTTINTTPNNASKLYTINYGKQGRFVEIKGRLTNNTGSITSNSIWFAFDTTDYSPDNTKFEFSGYTDTGLVVKCQILGGFFRVLGSLGNNQQIYFETTYFTLN